MLPSKPGTHLEETNVRKVQTYLHMHNQRSVTYGNIKGIKGKKYSIENLRNQF